MTKDWLEFWQKKNNFDESMIDNYQYFLSKVEKHIQLSPNDRVLDIGSGPGHLEDAWHNRVKEIHGLDISLRYNALAKAKHSQNGNVFFHDLDPNDYLNLSVVAHKSFTIVIVMSVLQYYRNAGEVKTLLTNIKQLAAPGAQILLCDLIVNEGMLKDMAAILWESLKAARLLSTITFFFKLRFQDIIRLKKHKAFWLFPRVTGWPSVNRYN
jgi:2-polyprenyl-3-methyl-5-hydroxy-6-metoxy-1,4-benzoquinol methylase